MTEFSFEVYASQPSGGVVQRVLNTTDGCVVPVNWRPGVARTLTLGYLDIRADNADDARDIARARAKRAYPHHDVVQVRLIREGM